MVMPGMGGRALAESLRQRKPDLKMLLMSGHLDPQSEAWSHEANMELLPKPFTAADLFDKVQLILLSKT